MNEREHEHPVTITVNGRPVQLKKAEVDGAEIKATAIAQGVPIQPNFVLQRDLPNGHEETIGDKDPITVHPHEQFTALAPDDHS
jgi:hypothetical protein